MDLLGRKIDELVNNDNPQPPGRYTVRWDGRKCTSGIYLVKMTSSHGTIIQKVMLIK
ncbi:MAG: T9SS type A sorting domain-containing protein [Fidelibacterota bacterium]